MKLAAPVAGVASTPTGGGYWEVTAAGGVIAFGNATYYGSMGGRHLSAPIVGIAAAPTGHGYWEVASDGGIFTFGTAAFYGSMGGRHLNAPVVGIAPTTTGHGYWEVASDGGVFAFGTAGFHGSMGGTRLARPVVGIAPTTTGKGYWEVASDGGIFTFGTAGFHGSMGGKPIGAPIVGMATDGSDGGYWEVAARGQVYTMGAAQFDGAVVDLAPATPEAAIVAVANGQVGKTDPYAYGPSGSTWCAFFTSWVWRQAGVPIPETGPAAAVGTWSLAHGGVVLPPSATPVPGDAALWVRAGTPNVWPDAGALNYPNIEHVNIVTQVLANGEIVTVGGNESDAVRRLGPYGVGGASGYFGQSIYGFVRPPA